MNCPYCRQTLESGFIYGDRYKMKWLEETKKLFLGIFALGSRVIQYENRNLFGRPKIKSYLCPNCNKMIIDLNEN